MLLVPGWLPKASLAKVYNENLLTSITKVTEKTILLGKNLSTSSIPYQQTNPWQNNDYNNGRVLPPGIMYGTVTKPSSLIDPVIIQKFVKVTAFGNRNKPLKISHTPYNSVMSVRMFSTTKCALQNQSINSESGILSSESEAALVSKTIEEPSLEKNASMDSETIASTDESYNDTSANIDTSSVGSSFDTQVLTSESPATEESNELILDFLPDVPTPLESSPLAEFLGMDPPLESLGLCSWWPAGRMQYFMEFLHSGTGLDLSWLQTIIITTIIVRALAFPFVVIAQKNVARLNNNMPQMQKLQEKMSDARRRGDIYESAALGNEMQKMMKEKNINPFKNIVPIMFQMPIFMSMFIGLRGMANLPVESMMSSGILWFHDLTVPDPFYILPALTAATLFLQLKLGADGMQSQGLGPVAKNIIKIMPVGVFFFTMNFPAAISFYWFTTNLLSVGQAKIVRMEGVREKFGIPKYIKWDENKLPVKDKSMKESFKETMDNWKVQNEISDRRSVDARAFREAGTVKPKKTFKHDPTKPKANVR